MVAGFVVGTGGGVTPSPGAGRLPSATGRDFAGLFRPASTEQVALSPNGEYIVFTLREDDRLSVVVAETARLDQALARVAVVSDAQATPRFGEHREKVPAAIIWMNWTDDERVVVETNGHVATAPDQSPPGIIMTFTRDGCEARVSLTGRDVPALVTAVAPAADLSRNPALLAPTVDDPHFSQGGTAAAEAEDPRSEGALFDTGTRFNLFPDRESERIDPETGFGFAPLSREGTDLDPESAQHIRGRTTSGDRLRLHRLDLTDGDALDIRRVGLVGTGHGGHLALHALASHPDRFRCAVALEPPVDLGAWLKSEDWTSRNPEAQLTRAYYGDARWLKARTLAGTVERIAKPALVLSHPGEDGTWRRSTHLTARAFARQLLTRSPDSRFQALSHDFAKGLPLAKAAVFGEIERFRNANVYNFDVTIGEAVEID